MRSTVVILFIILHNFALISSSKSIDSSKFQMVEPQKQREVTHLRFYYHDSLNVPNPVSVLMASTSSSNKSATLFGSIFVADAPLTEGVERDSKLVGRAQGLYAMSSKEEVSLTLCYTYHFLEGKYNGSSISTLGRNTVGEPVREVPVVGGTGLFKFSHGYGQLKAILYNLTTGIAVVEYNVYLIHG